MTDMVAQPASPGNDHHRRERHHQQHGLVLLRGALLALPEDEISSPGLIAGGGSPSESVDHWLALGVPAGSTCGFDLIQSDFVAVGGVDAAAV